jgi:hypothetical protein
VVWAGGRRGNGRLVMKFISSMTRLYEWGENEKIEGLLENY